MRREKNYNMKNAILFYKKKKDEKTNRNVEFKDLRENQELHLIAFCNSYDDKKWSPFQG